MAILLDESTRICVLGATGEIAARDLESAVAYGTTVVAGIAPGHGGETVAGVPVYDDAATAMDAHRFDAAVAYLPPRAYVAAMSEMIEQRPNWIAAITEGVPVHESAAVLATARANTVSILGPAINGIISPGRAKVGLLEHRAGLFVPGTVGLISRSGGQLNELAWQLQRVGLGVSTAAPVGGDAVVGSSYGELAALFEDDPHTQAIVAYCEAGADVERGLTEALRAGMVTKPVVVLVAGDWLTAFGRGRTFGHAGTFLGGDRTTAASKRVRLREVGAHVVSQSGQIGPTLVSLLS